MEQQNKEEIKENFCPPCLAAIPLAFAATGAGASQAIDGSTDSGRYSKDLLIGLSAGSVIIIILGICIFYGFKKKGIITCATCTD